MTANEFVNVKDVRDIFLYTKNGYVVSYLRIFFMNIELLSEEERAAKCRTMTATFDNDRKDFNYFTLPREIDLDRYSGELKYLYQSEMNDIGKRHILATMLGEATMLATSGENYEHQHYIRVWCPIGNDKTNAENENRNRIQEFKSRYMNAGIDTEILKEAEILKLCNLFGNQTQAAYEHIPENLYFEMFTKI